MPETKTLPPALDVLALTKQFSTQAGDLTILNDVDLHLTPGSSVAVTGPSGSGKSTLLYIIGLLDEPTSGAVVINGEHPHRLAEKDQARFRSRNIGFIFQDHHLLPQCTVLENVLIPCLAANGAGDVQEKRARQLLDRVGLNERLDHRPAQLSGGERQRVAVCRALINEPVLLLADEPTGNLDFKSADDVGTLLLEIASEQQTMLVCVTHSLELAARFPEHYELKAGQLVSRQTEAARP